MSKEPGALHKQRRKELENRPLIRAQAFGESLEPDKLGQLARYEVHLDRTLERTLSMLLSHHRIAQGLTLHPRKQGRFRPRLAFQRVGNRTHSRRRPLVGFPPSAHTKRCRRQSSVILSADPVGPPPGSTEKESHHNQIGKCPELSHRRSGITGRSGASGGSLRTRSEAALSRDVSLTDQRAVHLRSGGRPRP